MHCTYILPYGDPKLELHCCIYLPLNNILSTLSHCHATPGVPKTHWAFHTSPLSPCHCDCNLNLYLCFCINVQMTVSL